MTRWIWPIVGAGVGAMAVVGAVWLWGPSAPADEGWVVRPLGLSLRMTLAHPRHAPPSEAERRELYRLGERARVEIKECIAGMEGAPTHVELVFDDGTVTLASGPVPTRSDHGACVAQTLEGLWGEVDGRWRLGVNLALD